MLRVYGEEWNGFQFRSPTYLDGHFDPYEFDLVKWREHEPYEVTDWQSGEKKLSTKYCFSIARLWWNDKEPCFEFESVGLRYLEYREDGLEEWLMKWCKLKEYEILYEIE